MPSKEYEEFGNNLEECAEKETHELKGMSSKAACWL